jgi:hypothetical protein
MTLKAQLRERMTEREQLDEFMRQIQESYDQRLSTTSQPAVGLRCLNQTA